jgi:2'-5' RNA ligase
MQKIFALYTTITLVQKPDWLDSFVKKYQPRDLHVTLIQPRFIEEDEIPQLKQSVAQFFLAYRGGFMRVAFTDLVYDTEKSGAIMACAQNAPALVQLQKDLCHILSGYPQYADPIREEYEKNFRPHITIGDEIPEEGYQESLNYLKEGCYCEGEIRGVVLAIVNTMNSDTSLEQSVGSADKTMFNL